MNDKIDEYAELSQEIQGDEYAKGIAGEMGLISEDDFIPFGKILGALNHIGTGHIDTGYGPEAMDLWVTIDGVEYFITAKKSKRERLKTAN